MSDDEAFLLGIAAAPADDLRRLVYADYLDDHGRAAEAKYLRVVARLAATEGAIDPGCADAERAVALAEGIPEEWRARAAGRFELYFMSCGAAQKIGTIKYVRQLLGQGLAEAKAFVERAPVEVYTTRTAEFCISAERAFRAEVPSSRLAIHPNGGTSPVATAPYYITGNLTDWRELDRDVEPYVPRSDALDAFAHFLTAALGLPYAVAAERAAGEEVILAEGIGPLPTSPTPDRLGQLAAHFSQPDTWDILVHVTRHPPST